MRLRPQQEVEDLVSLDDYTCYARWWDGFARPPAFTLSVDPPPPSDPNRMLVIARRSAAQHGRSRDEVVAEITEVLAERLEESASDGRGRQTAQQLVAASSQHSEAAATGATSPTGKTDTPESAQAGRPTGRGRQQRGQQ